MSQHDYNIANGGGAAVRADINNALAAILSQNSGATAPTTTKPFMLWYDTTIGVLKMRNAADTAWIAAIDGVSGSNPQGMKNRIINGAMMIDQRNAGASVTITATSANQYVLDRYYLRAESATGSKVSVQRSTVAPAGFINSQLVTSLSAYTIGASEHFGIVQPVEGFNVADLGWGTANAQAITVSFKVRSSLTGTFGGSILNNAANRCFVFSYTINAANTWEDKTVTIAGDTTGTWLTDNGVGLYLAFSLAAGSSVTGAAGSWSSTFSRSVTGQTSLVGTNGATFYITGVQLEKGSIATAFDYRPFGTELALCQRYYEKSYNLDVTPGTGSSNPGCYEGGVSSFSNNVVYTPQIGFRVSKRATPTMSFYTFSGTLGSWEYARSGGNGSQTAIGDLIGSSGFSARIDVGAAWVVAYVTGHWVATAEL